MKLNGYINKLLTAYALFNLLTVFSHAVVFGASGDLDSTFRSGGFVTSAFGGAAYATALQADGKIILVGRVSSDFTLLRYNPDGTLDASFGANGRVTTEIAGDNEIPFAAAVQPDGKIVVVGQFENGGSFEYDFGIVRYNPDGSLDNSFGTNGKVSTTIGDREDSARSLVIQPDGKLLVGGYAYFAGNTASGRAALVRYNPDGTLDTTFDGDGKVVVQQNGLGEIALQSDGKIVVASSDGFGFESSFAVTRLNASGSADTTFGNAGKINTNFGDGGSFVNSVAVQPDGKIVAAGACHVNGSQRSDFGVARYNPDGSLDAGFDGDGKAVTSFGSTDDTATKIVLQPDTKIVVGGVAQGNSAAASKGFAVARYNADGSLDAAFGNAGLITANLLGGEYAYDLLLQADGKTVMVGSGGGAPQRFVAIRFTAAGTVDQTFNPDVAGQVTARLGTINGINDVIVQPDGKILAAGATSDNMLLDFALVRYNADGTPDLGFGTGGKVRTSISSSIDGAASVKLQPDGKIVAAGYAGTPGNTDIALARYNSDGTLDKTFDADGIVTLPRPNVSDTAYGLVIQPTGKLVIAGVTSVNSAQAFFLARFNTNGSLDTTFGTNGIVATRVGVDDFAKALVQQSDGKLIAAGTSRLASNAGDFAVVRYTADGALDSSFGTSGKVVTPVGNGNDDAAAIALQGDGKIVVAGNAAENTNSNAALVRYNTNGTLDASFGSGGKVITVLARNSVAEAVVVQPNQRIVVVGGRLNGSTSDMVVFRYNSSGLPDADFGVNGTAFADIDNRRELANAVTFQGNDKIIVAGGSASDFSSNVNESKLVLLRYQANTEVEFDFDGDGRTDISTFRPSNNVWYRLQSGSNNSFAADQFGATGDKIAPADYDGDGRTDLAVFRPASGAWYLQRSSQGFATAEFGLAEDLPVPADYDGDARADIAVFRPSSGVWYILRSRDNQVTTTQFGLSEDVPVVADYDADGTADIAVFRPSSGVWYLQKSRDGFAAAEWGISEDKPVAGDYDGDGKSDLAVWRPSSGVWYLLKSRDGFAAGEFGLPEDIPTPGDYDGDGKSDLAVWRLSTSVWYLQQSSSGASTAQFGLPADKPVPSAFVR